MLNVGHQVYQAQIHECAMESTFPFGGRRKVGFAAIIKQARTRGKYRIKRKARPLQGNGSEKSDIEVRAPSGAEVGDIQGLYRIECTKRTPPISRAFQLPIDPSRQHGLMVPVVHDQNGPPGKIACQPGLELLPGRRGLCQSRVIFGVSSIGEAGHGKGALPLELSGWHKPPIMRTVIEVGQHIEKSGCRVVGNPLGMSVDHRFQEHRIGICRLETPDIERRTENRR